MQLFDDNVTTLGGRVGSSLVDNPLNMCLTTKERGEPVWCGPNLYMSQAGGRTKGHIDVLPAVNVLVAHEPIKSADKIPVVRPYHSRYLSECALTTSIQHLPTKDVCCDAVILEMAAIVIRPQRDAWQAIRGA